MLLSILKAAPLLIVTRKAAAADYREKVVVVLGGFLSRFIIFALDILVVRSQRERNVATESHQTSFDEEIELDVHRSIVYVRTGEQDSIYSSSVSVVLYVRAKIR